MKVRPHRDEPEINFIPLIDVLLVILIFLMVTTTYSRYAELQISLPTAEAERQPDQIDVAVDAQGNYSVNQKAIGQSGSAPLAQEMRRLGASMKDPVVVISADGRSPHQSVITVMEAARMAGYGKITFTTQAASK